MTSMTSRHFPINRRRFLSATATASAGLALPEWFLRREQVLAAVPKPLSPNDKPGIALVGCGGMGRGDGAAASRFGEMRAICDVDDGNLAQAKRSWPKADTFKDFRKVMERDDVHVVLCGTPDHWHTLVSMAALRAGKDVYCEKPLTLTIEEGQKLVETSRTTGRILQTGSQQRSDRNFRLACELVRNGRIGKLKNAVVGLPTGPREGPFSPSPVPPGLDWDLWLGQCPKVDYVRQRCHGTFRYWYDYSGGMMTDWGAHHLDIVQWANGTERSGPVEIEGKSLVEMIPGGFETASQYDLKYTYANGVTVHCKSEAPDNVPNGVKFEGAAGWIFVTRGRIQASDPALLNEPLPASAEKLYVSRDHMGNLFECVRSRKQPICEAEIGHRSVSVCHLGVISIRLGRKLRWDPAKERFVNDAEADKRIARERRKPWTYDAV